MVELLLAATVHDPEERYLRRLFPAASTLATLYRARVVACTPATSGRTVDALAGAGFRVVPSTDQWVGENRRIALRAALAESPRTWLHCADFDRLLHWEGAYPDELRRMLGTEPGSDFVALGRTRRAFETHPGVQVATEGLTNAAFEALIGGHGSVDLVAGNCLLSPRAAAVVAAQSTEPTAATDLEWPALVFRELGVRPEYRAVEGLEFETPDFYPTEIEQAGSRAAWMRETYDRGSVWLTRGQIAMDSVAALVRVLDSAEPNASGRSREDSATTETTGAPPTEPPS